MYKEDNKTFRAPIKAFLMIGLLLFIMSSCGNDDLNPDAVQNASSQLCNRVTGPKAVYWDLSNGIPRVDLPNGLPPVVNNIGGTFSHPDFPLLGFNYPAGWDPVALRGPQTVGVNLIRQDGNGLWRWFSTSVNGVVGARQLRDFEITTMRQNLGLSANVDNICVNEGTASIAPGIVQSFSNILISVDGITALIVANVTNVEGLPTTQTNVQVAFGPSEQFDALIFDVYLAIGFQLLYGEGPRDSDNDGVIDIRDRFPNDPTRV